MIIFSKFRHDFVTATSSVLCLNDTEAGARDCLGPEASPFDASSTYVLNFRMFVLRRIIDDDFHVIRSLSITVYAIFTQ